MRPFSAEITPRRSAIFGHLLASLAFVAVGLWMLLAPDSGLVAHLGGVVVVGFFGLAAGLFAVDLIRPRSTLTVDREGVHLRERRGGGDFDAPWSRVRAVSAPSGERPGPVLVTLADSIDEHEDRSVNEEGETRTIPVMTGVAAAEIAAEIERHRRTFAPTASAQSLTRFGPSASQ